MVSKELSSALLGDIFNKNCPLINLDLEIKTDIFINFDV
jgi:hypothetical protein